MNTEKIKEYLEHQHNCARVQVIDFTDPLIRCDCGLREVLAELEKSEHDGCTGCPDITKCDGCNNNPNNAPPEVSGSKPQGCQESDQSYKFCTGGTIDYKGKKIAVQALKE